MLFEISRSSFSEALLHILLFNEAIDWFSTRVARWYIFIPIIQIVYKIMEGLAMENFGIF
jgi:hypothetical protein